MFGEFRLIDVLRAVVGRRRDFLLSLLRYIFKR